MIRLIHEVEDRTGLEGTAAVRLAQDVALLRAVARESVRSRATAGALELYAGLSRSQAHRIMARVRDAGVMDLASVERPGVPCRAAAEARR